MSEFQKKKIIKNLNKYLSTSTNISKYQPRNSEINDQHQYLFAQLFSVLNIAYGSKHKNFKI